MSGFMGAGSTWFSDFVHRWKDATPEPPGGSANETGDSFSGFLVLNIAGTTGTPILGGSANNYDNQIKTSFHNFKPLSDFISLAESYNFFNQNIEPHKYYRYDPGNGIYDYIESYYLINEDKTIAFGWVHNINKYWANSFIYTTWVSSQNPGLENYFDCERLPAPATIFEIEGFESNENYIIDFYPTRWGTFTLPSQQGHQTDGNGKLLIDLSSSPLACDSSHADYAFQVTVAPSPQRKGNLVPGSTEVGVTNVNFSIYPNPANGAVRLAIPYDEATMIIVQDMASRKLLELSVRSQTVVQLDLSSYSKGVYFIILQNSKGVKAKQLIIN